MPVTTAPPLPPNTFDDDDDDDGWQDMPVVRDDFNNTDLDEEDRRRYHYQPPSRSQQAVNATGDLIGVDSMGNDWRSRVDQNESDYTRLRVKEEDDNDEVHLRTKYLFDEDKAMTPLHQMQATKKLLTEAQRIAYVGVCALTVKEMAQELRTWKRKEFKAAVSNMELWSLKIMGRLYYHMELETSEQKMIEQLAEHGVQAMDLVPSLMTTHTVANPEYDPEEAKRRSEAEAAQQPDHPDFDDADDISIQTLVEPSSQQQKDDSTPKISPQNLNHNPQLPPTPTTPHTFPTSSTTSNPTQTTARVLADTTTSLAGVTTTLSSAEKDVTLDIRWTVLCDLFLVLIADSVYDARSRVLLERVAEKMGLGWLDVVRFESRVTEALEIQEDIERLEQQDIVESVQKAGKRKRYMMMGLATLGGGLVIGLSAGLLAPVIGIGLAGAFSTIGITGTGAFLGGTAGAAAITTGGILTGGAIAGRGMAKRTREVRTFDVLPLHNSKRVNCIITVPGFMNGVNDDVRLPFSVLDPIVGDVFSVLWEPEMLGETGSALKIMTQEIASQLGLTLLQATAMTALMSALQWPIILTKLGYLIDNPWSNALDRAKAAGLVLADVLLQRHLGVRPVTLIGFSLGARVIFYALLELSRQKAYGIVQDVILLGATLTASQSRWCETRSVVSGRYVNGFAKNDWVLNYLFRATSGGVGTVAGLREIKGVPGLENVDVTNKITGHMSYRTFLPLILDQLGFPVSADYFDEPEEPDFTEERIVVKEGEGKKKMKGGWLKSIEKEKSSSSNQHVSRPPTTSSYAKSTPASTPATAVGAAAAASQPPINPLGEEDDEDLPPRLNSPTTQSQNHHTSPSTPPGSDSGATTPKGPNRPHTPSTPNTPHIPTTPGGDPDVAHIPKHAGFDLNAMRKMIAQAAKERPEELQVEASTAPPAPAPAPAPPTTPTGAVRAASAVGNVGRADPRALAEESGGGYGFAGAKKSGSMPALPSVVLEDEKKNQLATEFSKTISLRGKEEEDRRYGGSSSSSPSLAYRPPTLTFGNEVNAPAWGSSTSSVSTSSPPLTDRSPSTASPPSSSSVGFSSPSFGGSGLQHNPFAMSSTTSLTFNAFNNNSVHSHHNRSYGHHNQFAAGGGMGTDSGAGLSFGSTDGTITNTGGSGSAGSGVDAWVVPGDIGRKPGSGVTASGFGANPWA